ncbi:MAG: efflux RND transporter periplasmic adaptor subunit [Gammaproteobacteria bacterium]|nr:efflux RND transporter periplasmic adaptor subunit [Gammaproteobacteria bacterium]MBI5615314.1 efflux RND transporter periplasmic adaptor subunit [Gammaproteobacteria bacterium]
MKNSELLNALKIDRDAPPRRSRVPVLIASLAIVGAAGFGWWRYGAAPAIEVQTALAAAPGATPAANPVLDATGYVTARRQATVSAKVTGRVLEVAIEEGQHVKEGEVLARLDPVDAQAALNLARAQLAAAEAQLADLRVQLVQAARDSRRQQDLVARHLTSTQAADDAVTHVQSLQARIVAQGRQVGVAKQNVEVAAVGLDNTIVRAPFDGVVTVKAAQPGEIVSPISAGGGFTRTGIGTVVDMDSLEIEVDVNEAYISRVAPDQSATATLNAYPEWHLPARVITIIPAADRSKATVKVRIAIETKDPRIVPDMGVHVGFLEEPKAPAAAPAGVLVPARAVAMTGAAANVFVVDGDHVVARTVTLGRTAGDLREVLSGLAAGERVVVAPPAGLRDGARIRRDGEART